MFKFNKTVNQVLSTSQKLETFYTSFSDLMNAAAIPYSIKFDYYRFILLYDSCFHFYISNELQFFLTETELKSNSFKEFKQNRIIKTSLDFSEICDNKSKTNNLTLESAHSRRIIQTLLGFWRLASRDKVMEEYFESKNIDKYFPENQNFLILNRLEEQKNNLDNLGQILTQLQQESTFQKDNFDKFSYNLSEKIEILLEFIFFRSFLVQNSFKLNDFTFSQFNYIQLILLIDSGIFSFTLKLIKIVNQFYEVYKEKNS